jgi:hypothetical protein
MKPEFHTALLPLSLNRNRILAAGTLSIYPAAISCG